MRQRRRSARTTHAPRKGELRREEILAAATAIFAEHGYERASIEIICAAIGIARGTLYQYFADKKALFREILEVHADRILEHMRPFDTLGLETPRDRATIEFLLAERIRRIYETAAGDRHAYRILFGEALAKHADAEDLLRRFDAAFRDAMAHELRAVAQVGIARVEDPEFMANFTLGAVLKTAQTYLFDADVPADPTALAQRTTALIARLLFFETATA